VVAEFQKYGGTILVEAMYKLIVIVWETEICRSVGGPALYSPFLKM
jgi:hypothetical protein